MHNPTPSTIKSTTAALLAATLLVGCGGEDKEAAQSPAAPPAPPSAQQPTPSPVTGAQSLSDLESLVAPIALYPDPLLAELLVASTYPPEIVEAAQWLESKPDPATVKSQGWDASIMRLTEVPSVITMMSEHLAWTTQLGNTFLATPDDVMDSIQGLRKRATDSGFLKDTPEQKVTTETAPATEEQGVDTGTATTAVLTKETISIEPAKSDTVYVPQYNSETAYSAPLAPAPATAAYPVPTYPAAAPSYYPVPTATATTSDTDPLLTFGAGALVGGLLTWGIMEWADDDDDWDDDYHVVHHYGDTVCRGGNCWSGGGGYYGGRGDINVDRGDITRNRNMNISGNEITVNRDGTFSQSQLASLRSQPATWRHDVRHRRGERYPQAAQKRLGQVRQPALAGHRLGAARALPAESRGFTRAAPQAAERRLSSDEVRGRLAQQPGAGDRPRARAADQRPSSGEVRGRLAQKPGAGERPKAREQRSRDQTRGRASKGSRESALGGVRSSGRQTRSESRRGSESRKVARAEPRRQQQIDRQRRSETARPNAFEGARNAGSTRNASHRGAASRQHTASAGRGGGGKRQRGGGGRRG